jgi:asparagine synthase (glutamine-hydrolysing)
MCGFSGFIGKHKLVSDPYSVLKKMGDTLVHRGPDDNGEWYDSKYDVGMAHRRLSILDLSSAGHQPLVSRSGRYVIAYNGEIYNHMLLRAELERSHTIKKWNGHSDTETLLACFDVWGVQKSLEQVTGMFAFAVWDCKEKVIILGRDRIGEKPLYYGWQNNTFFFGSELKSFKPHPAFQAEINRDAISLFLRHNYIPSPHSIYKGISKLQPGNLLILSIANPEPKIISYWSSSKIVTNGIRNQFGGSEVEAVDELERLTLESVKQQMISDVPLGAFLSGGVDSSAIVALMQVQSIRPIKTFTIGFNEGKYNEATFAKSVAKHLGTEHTELYVTHDDAINIIPKLSSLYCEPFSDSSQIPTFLVSQLARKHVTVSLSGDGGDELFCGYNRYQMTNNLWKKLSIFHPKLRTLLAKSILLFSPKDWDNIIRYIPKLNNLNNFGDKLHKGAGVLDSRSVNELYIGLVSHSRNPSDLVINSVEPKTLLTENSPYLEQLDDVQRMMALDLVSYLPDDILVKVDRASMGASLESRVPFLDHRIVEFAWKLPMSMKINNDQSKWILRQMLYKYVPKNLIERPKMGFGVPIDNWLRGPLREWAEGLLDENRLKKEGYFHPKPIRAMWDAHQSGHRNMQYGLWNILMFQAWLEDESSN